MGREKLLEDARNRRRQVQVEGDKHVRATTRPRLGRFWTLDWAGLGRTDPAGRCALRSTARFETEGNFNKTTLIFFSDSFRFFYLNHI